jgi:hypothetical protein
MPHIALYYAHVSTKFDGTRLQKQRRPQLGILYHDGRMSAIRAAAVTIRFIFKLSDEQLLHCQGIGTC